MVHVLYSEFHFVILFVLLGHRSTITDTIVIRKSKKHSFVVKRCNVAFMTFFFFCNVKRWLHWQLNGVLREFNFVLCQHWIKLGFILKRGRWRHGGRKDKLSREGRWCGNNEEGETGNGRKEVASMANKWRGGQWPPDCFIVANGSLSEVYLMYVGVCGYGGLCMWGQHH